MRVIREEKVILRYAPDRAQILEVAKARTLTEASDYFGVTKQALNKWLTKGLTKKSYEKIFGDINQ